MLTSGTGGMVSGARGKEHFSLCTSPGPWSKQQSYPNMSLEKRTSKENVCQTTAKMRASLSALSRVGVGGELGREGCCESRRKGDTWNSGPVCLNTADPLRFITVPVCALLKSLLSVRGWTGVLPTVVSLQTAENNEDQRKEKWKGENGFTVWEQSDVGLSRGWHFVSALSLSNLSLSNLRNLTTRPSPSCITHRGIS